MKRRSLLLLAASAAAPVRPRRAQDAETEAEIRRLVLAFNEAYESNRLDEYFDYYAPDVTQWWPEGRVSLDEYKKLWYELVAGGGGVEKNEIDDLRVQVDEARDAAVATYRVDVVTRQTDGSRSHETALETDVWFRRDGRWRIVHLHYNARPAPEPAAQARREARGRRG